MPIDLRTEQGQKWWAAKGRYDERRLTHRFRFWRFSHGYSLKDVSNITGISVSALAAFECGHWHYPFDLKRITELMEGEA